MKNFLTLSLLLFCIVANAQTQWNAVDKPLKRGLYVWNVSPTKWDNITSYKALLDNHKNSHKILIDFCKNKSFNQIYLYIGSWQYDRNAYFLQNKIYSQDSVASLIKKCKANCIDVIALYYLWDNMNTITDALTANNTVASVIANFNKAHPNAGFSGIQCDQEPNVTTTYVEYLDACKQGAAKCEELNPSIKAVGGEPIFFSVTTRNSWNSQTITYNGVSKTMMQHMMDVCHHTTFMNYVSGASFGTRGNDLLTYADQIKKPTSIAVETGTINAQTIETYADEITSKGLDWFQTTMDNFIATNFISHPYFERIVIHDFNQFFLHWFNKNASEYIDANSSWTYTSTNLCADTSPWGKIPASANDLEIQNLDVLIYPNPTNGVSFLTVNNIEFGELNIFVTTISGQIVLKQQEMIMEGTNSITIQSESLPQGMYWIVLYKNHRISTRKLAIIK